MVEPSGEKRMLRCLPGFIPWGREMSNGGCDGGSVKEATGTTYAFVSMVS